MNTTSQPHTSHGQQPRYPFHSSTDVQLRFSDVDALGHVNNSIYFQLFDFAKIHYFKHVRNDDTNWGQPSIIIASVKCDFLSQTHFNEPIKILTQVDHIGDKSLTLLQQLINSDTQEVKCVCSTVMVNLDPTTGQPSRLPDVWRNAIAAFEQRAM